MNAKVVRIGNSVGVIIPKPLTRTLGLKPGDRIDVEFDEDGGLILLSKKPLAALDRAFIREVEEFSRRYDADLRRLAE